MYYLNPLRTSAKTLLFLRIEFICIIWTSVIIITSPNLFLRIEFICIIWTRWGLERGRTRFLRIEFICIIWTLYTPGSRPDRSWGLNLFVLFELLQQISVDWSRSWGLNLFVLFERKAKKWISFTVLEDWIYLYYLNLYQVSNLGRVFLRIEFICIIWTKRHKRKDAYSSWGLNLFVLFELNQKYYKELCSSWGLNLFVLFERYKWRYRHSGGSWGLNLFVLFERNNMAEVTGYVLEDWIYLYYLNFMQGKSWELRFLRIEFICIIWTQQGTVWYSFQFLRIEFICIIWTVTLKEKKRLGSWGLNLFVLFERW